MKINSFIGRLALPAAVLLQLLLAAVSLSAQTADVYTLRTQQEQFDERGFAQNAAITVDGNLMVANSNGNVSYSYPVSKFIAGGHQFEVSLNYCNSVEFAAFRSYTVANRFGGTYKGWNRFQQNRPAWILNFNGFALNVISTTPHFRMDPSARPFAPANATFNDRDLIWSVDGYDFCNRMYDLNAADSKSYYSDDIRILRGDGSVLKLVNVKRKLGSILFESDKRPELYTGYYFANEANTHEYGYVEYDSTYWVSRLREIDSQQCTDSTRRYPLIPRKLHFYPGDGLEYIFREWPTPYGMLPFRGVDSLSGGINGSPTIFYLEEVRSNVGEVLTFERTRHYPYIARGLEPVWEDSTRGRAIITSFLGHNISFGYNSMLIEALGRTATVRFDTVLRSGNAENWETMQFANNGSLTRYALEMATWPETQKALYKSFVGYVTEIVDPEGRKTTFDYEPYTRVYKKYSFPNPSAVDAELTLRNYRLTEVVEPDEKYSIYYHGGSSMDITSGITPYSYAVNNMVDSVVKSTLSGSRLSSDDYKFPAYGVVGNPEKVSWDWGTNTYHRSAFGYSSYDLDVDVMGAPPAKQTTLASVAEEAGTYSSSTETTYETNHAVAGGGTIDLLYLRLPKEETKLENGQEKSFTTFKYVVDSVRRFITDTTAKHRFGWEVMKKIVQQRDPSNHSRVLRTDTIEYVHRNPTDTTVIWAEHRWDKFATYQNYFYMRDTLQDSLVLHTDPEKLLYWPPVGQFIDTYDTAHVLIPPHYGMEARQVSYDENGTLIEGKKNVYQTKLMYGYFREYLDALIADSVIGRGGVTMLKGKYDYTGGWGANLPMRIENALGARVLYSYSPWFCWNNGVAQWDTCVSDNLPEMNRLTRDGTIQTDLFYGASMGSWFGKPLGEAKMVRKYDASNQLVDRGIFSYTENSFFGVTSGTLDPNGWYSKFDYDRNGRLKRAWLPSDFPLDTLRKNVPGDTLYFNSVESLGFAGNTYFNRRVDTLRCWTDSIGVDRSTILTGGTSTIWLPDTLIAARPVTTEPDCARPTIRSRAGKKRDGGLQMTFVNKIPFDEVIKCPTCDGYVAQLDHYIGGASPLANVVSVDSIFLDLTMAVAGGSCTDVRVTSSQINLSKLFVFGCSSIKGLSSGSGGVTKRDERGGLLSEGSSNFRTFRIDLTPFKSQILALSHGSMLSFQVKTTTPGAVVQLVQGLNGEDTRPRLIVDGRFRKVRTFDKDYTLAYAYDDANLTTEITAKVDDSITTANKYNFTSKPTRFTHSEHQFGAGGRLLESRLEHVFDDGSLRTDYVNHEYSGNGLKLRSYDQEGDSTATEYDAAGRPVRAYNPDGTSSTIDYYYGTASTFGISDQDFYGFCAAKVTTDESGTKSVQYSDAFDRVRREIADSGSSVSHLNLITKYEYDVFGRLMKVINPKGDTRKYWYDPYGRVKYKYQPDLGTVSYAYDAVGNVRFTQSDEQSRHSELGFSQYDDLNRLVVAGEARLADESMPDTTAPSGTAPNLNRLTDRLDPNKLHDSLSSYLTASRSLWLEPAAPVPTFWDRKDFDTSGCTLAADSSLGETTAPVGPLMRHTVQYYNQLMSSAPAGYFEHASMFPEFIRMGMYYDSLPRIKGAVWGTFPEHERWDSLAPRGKVRNLRGRQAVVAYREHGGEPFHYAVTSYDERGRVEALLRYTENLGFDAVYYTYNAMNRVVTVRVVDPLRQYVTWYGYDNNGRVDSVWSLLSSYSSGLGVKAPKYVAAPLRPKDLAADIVYRYDKLGRVDTMQYDPVGVLVTYAYDHRKWLDSMTATQWGQSLFKQVLTYDVTGQIVSQRWRHGLGASVTHTYGYDSVGRLTRWFDGTDTTKYWYDAVGNRLQRIKTGGGINSTALTYGAGGANRVSQTVTTIGSLQRTVAYGYDRDGAVTGLGNSSTSGTTTRDSLVYSWRDLNRQYLHYGIGTGNTVTTTEDWRYRYNWMSEREQKRLYLKLDSLHNPVAGTDWVYYLLGAAREQLAVFHGQEKMLPACSDSFSVYLYPTEYLTNGVGNVLALTTKPLTGSPNGMKEYNVVDNLGSTRVRLSLMTPTTTTDYEPFGSILAGTESRKSYIDKEFDHESAFGDYGVRKYDPVTGRFLSVDPLWENYPSETPYHYSNNNPISEKDPEGKDPSLPARVGVGALIGAAVAVISEYSREKASGKEVDGMKILAAAAHGALVGGVAGATLNVGLVGSIAFGAAAEVVGGGLERAIVPTPGKSRLRSAGDLPAITTDAISGAAGGAIGAKISNAMKPIANGATRMLAPRTILAKSGFKTVTPSAFVRGSANVMYYGSKLGVPGIVGGFVGPGVQTGYSAVSGYSPTSRPIIRSYPPRDAVSVSTNRIRP